MTISLVKTVPAENQNTLPSDLADSDPNTDDFAAFLGVSVAAPPTTAPVKVVTPEPPVETTVEIQAIKNFSEGDPIKPRPSEKIYFKVADPIRPEPRVIADSKPLAFIRLGGNPHRGGMNEDLFKQNLTPNMDLGFHPPTAHRDSQDSRFKTSVPNLTVDPQKSLENGPMQFSEASAIVKADDLSQVSGNRTGLIIPEQLNKNLAIAKFSSVSEIVRADNSMQPVDGTGEGRIGQKIVERPGFDLSDENEWKSPTGSGEVSDVVKKAGSNQMADPNDFASEQKIFKQSNLSLENEPALLAPLSDVSDNDSNQIVVQKESNTEQKVVEHLKQNFPGETEKKSIVQSALTTAEEDSHQETQSKVLPGKLSKISNILETDNIAKTDIASEFVVGRLIFKQRQHNVSIEERPLSAHSEYGSLPSDAEISIQENPSGIPFDNFLNSFSKGQKIGDNTPHTNDLHLRIFEQMEPRILELAAFTQAGKEKRIFRIRLNPAELGGVEVTLVKGAAGMISAHFQTESESTRHVLNASLVQLRNSLENSGWQVGDLQTSCRSFSANADPQGQAQARHFGTPKHPLAETANFGGHSNNPDDEHDRLVSLRA